MVNTERVTDDRPDLSTTRRALHGVAELVLAGPEYRTSETIRLRITPGGFATIRQPDLRVENGYLVSATGSVPIHGHSCADLAAGAGVDVGAPPDLYADGSGVEPDEVLDLDPAHAALIVAAFGIGDAALQHFAPDTPAVLWPEHFDLGISLDEVNYGVSAGDSYLAEPYAYVGPWTTRADPFFNAPFGAARPIRLLGDALAVSAFFTEGHRIALL